MAQAHERATGAMLLGRRTYEDFAGFWPSRSATPITEVLNNTRKYVASNARGAAALGQLDAPGGRRRGSGGQAQAGGGRGRPVVLGQRRPGRSLMRAPGGRVRRAIHPLVLGSGRRLFPDGGAPRCVYRVEDHAHRRGDRDLPAGLSLWRLRWRLLPHRGKGVSGGRGVGGSAPGRAVPEPHGFACRKPDSNPKQFAPRTTTERPCARAHSLPSMMQLSVAQRRQRAAAGHRRRRYWPSRTTSPVSGSTVACTGLREIATSTLPLIGTPFHPTSCALALPLSPRRPGT